MLRAIIVSLILFFIQPPAQAEPATDADRMAIQAVITAQINAFRADDAARAYAHAAPSIQQIFPTPESFMAMVKQGYKPVYRPQSFRFGQFGEDFSQRVSIIGPDGRTYEALYTMQRQPDGTWRITGCSLLEIPGTAV